METASTGDGVERAGAGPRDRSAGLRRFATVAVPVVCALGVVLAAPLLHATGGSAIDPLLWLPLVVSCAVVGAILWNRRVGGVLGPLFAWTAVVVSFTVLIQAYAGFAAARDLPIAPWVAWCFQWSLGGTDVFLLILQLFPTGAPVSPRWRILTWTTIAVAMLSAFGPALGATTQFAQNFPGVEPPVRLLPRSVADGLVGFTGIGLTFLFLASAAEVVARFHRSRGEERAQMKWFTAAATTVAIGFAMGMFVVPGGPVVAFALLTPLIPIAAGIAIAKYHLYDIDVVISKTIVYGTLVGFTTATYVLVVVLAGRAIGAETASLALSIAATAIVAVAFQPLRERVQHLANRLVYGRRATPYEVLATFSDRVGSSYATKDILPRTAQILAEGVHATRAVVWLRVADRLTPAASWPTDRVDDLQDVDIADRDADPELTGTHVAAVRYRGEVLGALAVDKPRDEPINGDERALVDDLASQAGLVLSNVRMTADLEARLATIERQAAELKASRQRIVTAQDAERRRLERNIHDGAQQHLVALAVKLRLAKSLLERDPPRAREMLAALRSEVDEALETLQGLALGIYPPLLEDRGIGPALAAHADRGVLPVRLHLDGTGRYPIEVEAAVYFCVLEAIQNAAKYAQARGVDVRLAERGSELSFEVSDDGVGFDADVNGDGTGLAGMRDRLAVFGGDARIESALGHGTRVTGCVPLGAEADR